MDVHFDGSYRSISIFVAMMGVLLINRTLQLQTVATEIATAQTRASTEAAKAAMDANTLNREFFIAAQRPWIAANFSLTDGLRWDKDNGVFIHLMVKLMNTGNTPSLNTTVEIEAYNGVLPLNHLPRQIDFADKRKQHGIRRGIAVFPGHTVHQYIAVQLSNDEIIKSAMLAIDDSDETWDWICPVVSGCVQYRPALNAAIHQTGFILTLYRAVSPENAFVIAPSRGDIPIEHLELRRWSNDGRVD